MLNFRFQFWIVHLAIRPSPVVASLVRLRTDRRTDDRRLLRSRDPSRRKSSGVDEPLDQRQLRPD